MHFKHITCDNYATINFILITDPPLPPIDITDISCTADTTADITWTPPSSSSQCITGYTINTNTTITCTCNSYYMQPYCSLYKISSNHFGNTEMTNTIITIPHLG